MATSKDKSPNISDNAPEGVDISEAEKAKARGEGAKEAEKQTGEAVYRSLTDGAPVGEAPDFKYHGYDEVQLYADRLEYGVTEFEKFAADKNNGVPENKLYGLLALERNGQNRTPYVKALMKRLGVKADELPGGGPGFTNDVTNITDL